MDSQRWRQIDAVFGAALDRAPEERTAFLDQACRDDPDLRREVEALLGSENELGDFLDAPVAGFEATAEAGTTSRAGESIGPYRIEREIARGGMGTVYLAVRADDEYQRRVAIKVLRRGMRSEDLIRRFHSERQILANLDHPVIAKLFDGATTADGRPYLVMEYIEGLPVDEYCDREGLSIRQRIELFRVICSAVHYAHQNLVVHRDIKPSNILVTAGGAPRLLDFGIAKLLDPEAFPVPVAATVTGLRPMTPLYASPEQIRGAAITTASDVYSLGVLLYLLLAGRLPYDLTGLVPSEIERVLTEEEPEPPSTAAASAALETSADTAPKSRFRRVLRHRGAKSHQLRRRLSGDLDNIVLMALAKDPSRRYSSVEQLSEDLRRHLVGLPVLARPKTLVYRLSRYLRRHRLLVGTAALILVLVTAFALAMARQAADTARQRDLAEVERDRAEQVSRFLIDLFREVDPWSGDGNSVTAREILDHGVEKIDQELADQPALRASLQDAVGTLYLNLGLYDQAAPLLDSALATRQAVLGTEHRDFAATLHHIGSLYLRQGRFDESEKLLLRALSIRVKVLRAAPAGSVPAGEVLARDAPAGEAPIRGEEAGGGDRLPDDPEVGVILTSLSAVYRSQGRFAEGEDFGRRGLEILRRTLETGHPEIARSLRALAGIHARQGDYLEAERLLEEALAIDLETSGESHWSTASTYSNLGYLIRQRGEYAQSEDYYRRAVAAWEQLWPDGHPRFADALVGLANTFRVQERYAEAETHLRRALPFYENMLGEEHALVANCVYELGNLLSLQNRIAEAEPFLIRALEVRERVLAADHPWVAESLRGIADLRRSQGRLAEAEALYQRALAIWEEHPHHEGTLGIPQSYAALLRATGRPDDAAELESRAAGRD